VDKKQLSIIHYEKMLERALSQVKFRAERSSRFVFPVAMVNNVKNRTIITNFKEIVEKLNRDKQHLASFFFKEFAVNGIIEDDTLVLFGKFPFEKVNMSLKYYIKKYVLCPVCNSNDTVIEKERKNIFLKCLACGAISTVLE
jgi:Translation initiation factor 2, beta subunit (eIF-2beta)/eIF-5 N-terminal domain